MYETRSAYDRGVNTFSPQGRLFQVEYAIKAIELGSCAVGVKTSKGVVLGVEKRITSTLLEQSSVKKIFEVDTHVACAISGLTADARTLVDHARVEAVNHTFVYNEKIKVASLAQSVCDLALSFGEGGDEAETKMSRPFGVALLLGGCDDGKPSLYHTDPSGTFLEYQAHAIGNGSEGAHTILKDNYDSSMSLEDAEDLVLKVLTETMQDKVTSANVEICSITPDAGYSMYPGARLEALIKRAAAAAAAEEDA